MGRRKPRTNAEITETTIASLVGRARREFGARGYAEASVEYIASEVGLTKGAVYYHFKSKKGLFEAVLRDCQRDIVARIESQATSSADPREAVIDGCVAFVDVVMDEAFRQIVLLDAPAVLGYGKWRQIDAEFGLGSLKAGLQAWMTDDSLLDLDIVAHAISGALNDLVLFAAESPDPSAAHERVRRQLPLLVASMLDAFGPAEPTASTWT